MKLQSPIASQRFQQQLSISNRIRHRVGEWSPLPDSFLQSTVIAHFEENAARFPDRPAVSHKGRELTYAELNQAANQVAHGLIDRPGLGTEPVALLTPLSIQAHIFILGALKAGRPYTAPDLQHPANRIEQMLANARPALVISQADNLALAQAATPAGTAIATFDSFLPDSADSVQAATNPTVALRPETLFAIVYTSGTTGAPKGVYFNHLAVTQRVMRHCHQVNLTDRDRLAATRYPGFTPRDLFAPLMVGATLCLFDLAAADLASLARWLAEEQITHMSGAVSGIRNLLPHFPAYDRMPHLRYLSAGSEALQASDVNLFRQNCTPGSVLSGEYGATESLGGFYSYRFDHTSLVPTDGIPAGYSQEGFSTLIVDDDGNPLPSGQVGQIVARSRYLAQGYWRQPELTASRFLQDPEDPSQHLYFTGDLGRLETDGCLIHLGRKDHQLKIRGFLVEPIEVERALIALGYYQAVAVDARPNRHGEAVLIAWLVPSGPPPSISEVRNQLALTLPEYMIPAQFVMLEQLPLTVANKVERSALPDPTPERPALQTDYRPAKTPLEEWLVSCWEEVLGVEPIGVDDNFLELGGNSLQAMRVIVRLRERLDDWFYVAMLFDAPTVSGLAVRILEEYATQQDASVQPSSDSQPTPVVAEAPAQDDTPAQLARLQSQWTSARSRPGRTTKNPPAIFILAPGRSGTTLLRVMLGSHPQLFAPPELFLLNYDRVADWLAVAANNRGFHREGVLQALMQIQQIDLAEAEGIVARYAQKGASTQQLYGHIQQQIAPRLLVDKTPAYAHSTKTLQMAELEFDQPLYIHLLRHPAAVVDSFVGVRFDRLTAVPRQLGLMPERYAELNWLLANRNIQTFLRDIPAQRQTRVYFEELVTAPRPAMESLCQFLGIDFSGEMLEPYRNPQQQMTIGIHPLTTMAGDPKFHTHNRIEPSVAARWQESYTADSLSANTWAMAQSFGYSQTMSQSAGETKAGQ